jgi:altronate dehydratase
LGCENNGLDGIKEYLKPYGRDNIAFFNCQEVDDEITYAVDLVKQFAEKAKDFKRKKLTLKNYV